MSQFGSFDGLDNRKTVVALFQRLGRGLPDFIARRLRADVLRAMVLLSTDCFARLPCVVTPCSPAEAYLLFVAICSALGVPVEKAARDLEDIVRFKESLTGDRLAALRRR
jgi:hypothetical protein